MANLKWERLRDTSEHRESTKRFIITPGEGKSANQLALRDLRTDPERTAPALAIGTLKFCKDQAQKRATEEEEKLSAKNAETRDSEDKPTGEPAEQFLPKTAAEQQQSDNAAPEESDAKEDLSADEPEDGRTFAKREVKTTERSATKAPAKKGKSK